MIWSGSAPLDGNTKVEGISQIWESSLESKGFKPHIRPPPLRSDTGRMSSLSCSETSRAYQRDIRNHAPHFKSAHTDLLTSSHRVEAAD